MNMDARARRIIEMHGSGSTWAEIGRAVGISKTRAGQILRAHGVRGAVRHGRSKRPLAERFAEKVDVNGPIPPHRPELGPCHIWTGKRDRKGYGWVGLGSASEGTAQAHRVAFFIEHGRWPTPCCLHLCDNPSCVRASHLVEGTKSDNSRDAVTKGRWPMMKLTPNQVAVIRSSSLPARVLAVRFGVTPATICKTRRGAAHGPIDIEPTTSDFKPTTFDVECEVDVCEVCGAVGTEDAPLAVCEGALVCDGCAHQHGHKLAQFRDEMNAELRRL